MVLESGVKARTKEREASDGTGMREERGVGDFPAGRILDSRPLLDTASHW